MKSWLVSKTLTNFIFTFKFNLKFELNFYLKFNLKTDLIQLNIRPWGWCWINWIELIFPWIFVWSLIQVYYTERKIQRSSDTYSNCGTNAHSGVSFQMFLDNMRTVWGKTTYFVLVLQSLYVSGERYYIFLSV